MTIKISFQEVIHAYFRLVRLGMDPARALHVTKQAYPEFRQQLAQEVTT